MSILLWTTGTLLGIGLVGVAFQAAGSIIDARRYPPPGKLVPVPGTRLHAYSLGEGGPTIILESGIAASSLNWRALQTELAQFARVISYDRAGFGWSGPAPSTRTVENLATELETMLDALRISGPVILVAHSFGSLIARTYCCRENSRVAGVVLLDPLDSERWRHLPPDESRRLLLGAKLARRGALLAKLGVVRFALGLLMAGARTLPQGIARAASGSGERLIAHLTGEVRKLPPEVWPAIRAHWSRPQSFSTLAAYLSQLPACAHEVPYASLGDLPLIVISAENAEDPQVNEHRRLAALSSRGEHVIAEKSGHWVHLDRTDVVVAAVRRCCSAATGFNSVDVRVSRP
jgi:pimeloyl-ACP methyl ester carboxylesterase